ncbi:MAG: hypothetical protein JOZ54_01380 [Acidobacteria bacterium]|nr:hypothetical protein [Acidobacteriota bacterium]
MDLRETAAALASEFGAGTISPDLRRRFIAFRTTLFQRGIFDPVLVRFDSATAPAASASQIAEELATLATSL